MNIPNFAPAEEQRLAYVTGASTGALRQSQSSAVSWSAILAGAAAAAALSLILLLLGSGLGMSSVSPWVNNGISAKTFGLSAIQWLAFTQVAASGLGGYLAGRLRTKWTETHSDVVYFRDTAHGFLAWAVASLLTAALLTSVIGAMVGGGIQAGVSMAGGVSAAGTVGAVAAGSGIGKSDGNEGLDEGPMGYLVDTLFRKETPAAPAATGAGPQQDSTSTTAATSTTGGSSAERSSTEVSRIFMSTLRTGSLPAEDVRHVGQLVAERTWVSQADAEKRVSDTYARAQAKLRDAETAAKDAADSARKASAYTALWLFVSLLIGAFVASLAATYGGRQRDL